MKYDTKIISLILKEMLQKEGFTQKRVYENLDISRPTLETYLSTGEMPLKKFIELCEILKLEPSTFFLNQGVTVQSVIDSKNVNQNINSNAEIENLKTKVSGLEKEVELLREMNAMLKANKA